MTTPPDGPTVQKTGVKRGRKPVIPDPPIRIGQLINATIDLAGPQELRVDTYGSHNDRGGHISIASDSTLIYLHGRKAAQVYADAWIDAWYVASRLPLRVDVDPRPDTGPVMMIRAYGSEQVEHVHDTARGVAVIRVGRLTWQLHDQEAWWTSAPSWRQVAALAPLVIAPQNTAPLPRRIGHRTRPIAPTSVDVNIPGRRARDL